MKTKKTIKLMEVCGTHTMAIARSGIKRLLPDNIRLISGPGCPVCVTAQADIDKAIEIAGKSGVIMTTFGDMMRVPGSRTSFARIKGDGADIRVVYSCLDALSIAKENPSQKVVFMGVGFETTSPTIASTILEAKKQGLKNFFVLSYFKLVFPALEAIITSRDVNIDGFICPGHVSVITGTGPYNLLAKRYKKPCVITGFGDTDVIRGIRRLVDQVNKGEGRVEIEYDRVVDEEGNSEARKILYSVFEPTHAEWRGIGVLKKSGLKLKKEFKQFDAEKEFDVKIPKPVKNKGCLCGRILQGIKSPDECKLFRKACTPENPIGPCMVSSEGTCAAYYRYG